MRQFISESFLCAIPPILTILPIFMFCQNLNQTAANLGQNLHALKRSCRDKRTGRVVSKYGIKFQFQNDRFDPFQMFQFSLQILEIPFQLTGMRFFQLDFDLLRAMIGSITTYMVIFISFLPPKSIFPDYSEMNTLFK